MNIKILLLEDELSIRSFIKINLKREGYEVIEASSAKEALNKIENENISIALLDVMIEGEIDGFQVCKILREKYDHIGIIMLTAKSQEDDKLMGFNLGADDYLVKPFSPKELIARINTLLRRVIKENPQKQKNDILESFPFILDMKMKKLFKNGYEIEVTPTEFEIIKYLISNEDVALSRDDILDHIWGVNYIGDLKVVDVNIRRIRSKIEEIPSKPKYLQTVWGHGYSWRKDDMFEKEYKK